MTSFAIVVCVLAGIAAGLGNGFIGASASAILAPILIAVLDFDPYAAIAISLSCDTLASITSSVVYAKNKHLDVKHGVVLILPAIVFAVIGSYAASFAPSAALGSMTMIFMLVLGLVFIRKSRGDMKESTAGGKNAPKPTAKALVLSALCGAGIGFACGFMGAGGGMMIFMPLVFLLGYQVLTGVGTGVLIMAIMAGIGAVSHFVIGGVSDIAVLLVCVVVATIVSPLAAMIANRVKARTLYLVTGSVLVVLGAAVLIVYYFV